MLVRLIWTKFINSGNLKNRIESSSIYSSPKKFKCITKNASHLVSEWFLNFFYSKHLNFCRHHRKAGLFDIVLTRLEKRDFWAAYLTAWRKSGLSQNTLFRTTGLSDSQFSYWRQQLTNTPPTPMCITGMTFVATSVPSTPVHAGSTYDIITCNWSYSQPYLRSG